MFVWLAVVIYWQSTSRLPSEADLVLYFGVLPLALVAGGWGIYKLATRPKSVATAPDGALKDDAQQQSDQAAKDVEHERAWTLHIIASSLHTAAGNSSAEVLGKLKDGDIEPELDPELKTPEGFSVFSARIQDLDDADTQEFFAQWQNTTAHAALAWSQSQYRALHLASLSVHELAALASEHPDVQLYLRLAEAGRPGKEDAVLLLRMIFLWPNHWSDRHQSMASDWMKSLAAQHGWPEPRIVTQEATSEHANALSLLDYINVSTHKAQLPTVGILVACDSGIEQAYVDELAANNNLFGGRNTQGIKPGEVSAGLLFADAGQSQLLGEGPFSSLHRASWANRDKSADDKGRVTTDLLTRLVELALETSKVQIADIQLVSSDNDHKPSRESELAEMLSMTFPELDPAKDAVKVPQACGSTHHSSATIAALCVAHQYVIDEQLPVMCTSLHGPLLRAAVVLTVPTEKTDENKQDSTLAA
ncbi:MAG: hypothetical protein ABIQ90_08675 [Polaromonas sp.]